jgi:uncharacterized membrane protein
MLAYAVAGYAHWHVSGQATTGFAAQLFSSKSHYIMAPDIYAGGHDTSRLNLCCVQEFMGIVDEVGEDVHSVRRWVQAVRSMTAAVI